MLTLPLILLCALAPAAEAASSTDTFFEMRERLEAKRREQEEALRALREKQAELGRQLAQKVDEIRAIQTEQGRLGQLSPRPEDANQLLNAAEIAALLAGRAGRCLVEPGAAAGEYYFEKDGYRLRVQLKPEYVTGRIEALAAMAGGADHDTLLVQQSTVGEADDPSAVELRYDLKAQEFTEASVTGRLVRTPERSFSLGQLIPGSARSRGIVTLDCTE